MKKKSVTKTEMTMFAGSNGWSRKSCDEVVDKVDDGSRKVAMTLSSRFTMVRGKSAMTSWTGIGRGKAAMKLSTKLTMARGKSAMTSWTRIGRGRSAMTVVGRATIGTMRVPSITIGIGSVSRRSGCRGGYRKR